MKDICQALYEYLSADADIKKRINGRIYPIVLPQNALLPAIVYSPVLANYDSALQGDTGFVRQTVQFVSHDTTYKKTRKLSRLIAKQLTAEKVGLNYGNKGKWSRGAIHYILNNEKYIGCALMQKYYNEDGICRKNRGEVKQYYMENTHEAIISVEDFQKVQELMRERACECEIGVARKNYEFTGKIRCGCCGGNYIRKVQNCGKPYEVIVWVCSRKDTFGSENCYGTRIKDTVLKEKFVECYNEFTAIKGEGDSLSALNQQLAWLLEQERELNALKVNRMIEIADYNAEWKAVKAQIDDINKQIEKQSIQKLTKTDLVPITEYDESKVKTFLDYAVMTPKKITFIFINGVEISREYTNGASGNAKGWYDRRIERLAREKEVAYGN